MFQRIALYVGAVLGLGLLSVLILVQAGVFMGYEERELRFRELSAPRIAWIEEETRDCIVFHAKDLPDSHDYWTASEFNYGFYDDWMLYALLVDEFPNAVSSVHNLDFVFLQLLVVDNCPDDKSLRSEYAHWYRRVYGRPVENWKHFSVAINDLR